MEVNKEKILKNINSIIAGLLIVTCFLPMFRLNSSELGYANDLKMSGFAAIVGLEFTDGSETSMCIPAFFLILCPLLLILCNYINQLKSIKQNVIYIAPVGSIIALFLTKMSVDSQISTSIATNIGFWAYLILDLILLILAYLQFKNIPINENEIKNFVKESSVRLGDAFQEVGTTVCSNCGNKILRGKNFCPKCGNPIVKEEIVNKELHCPQCGKFVKGNNSFCSGCGTKLEIIPPQRVCSNCGTELAETASFCPKCGTKRL